MSKRGMDMQGGEDRYGAYGNNDGGNAGFGASDAPRQATAAQLAKRKIASLKGRSSGRNSRQGSPATGAPPNAFSQNQTFQPPTATGGGFNFSFGQSPSFGQGQQQEQNGFGNNENGGNAFGNTQNNGGVFGSSTPANPFAMNSQPQQTSFNAPASGGFNPSSFGQQPTSSFPAASSGTPPPSTFSFGQSKPEQNGFGSGSGTGNAFGGFGGQQQNGSSTFTFGASQPAPAPAAKATTPSFSFGATQPEPAKANTSFQFNTSQSTQDTAKASTPSFGGFGQSTQTNGDKPASIFGASPAATPEPSTPGESVFSSLANKSNGIKPGMFTQNNDQTPKPTTFSFGAQPTTNGETSKSTPTFSFGQPKEKSAAPEEQTPKPSTLFSGIGQETPKSSTSFSFSQAKETPSTSNGASNLFSGLSQNAEQKTDSPFKFTQSQQTPSAGNLFSRANQQKETPKFSFGAPKADDTSMASPETSPEKQKTAGQSLFSPATTIPPTAQTPAASGKSLFDRITPNDPPATAPKPSFTSNLFSGEASTPASQSKSLFNPPATTGKPTASLFQSNQEKKDDEPKKFQPSLFQPSKPAESTSTSTSLFAPSTPQSSNALSAPTPAASSSFTSKSSSIPLPSVTMVDKVKSLNDGLIKHLSAQDKTKDWTPILKYYLEEVSKMGGDSDQTPKAAPSARPQNIFAQQPAFGAQATPKASSSNIFKNAQTPAVGSSLRNQITQSPPATAPVSRKRSADEQITKDSDVFQAPATEKRVRPNESVNYPKLPETASNTAKLFESTLSKSTSNDVPKFGPPDDVVAKVREDAAKKADSEKAKDSAPKFGFTPTTSATTGSTGFKPIFSTAEKTGDSAPKFGFKPTVSASSGPSAFDAFAQKAKAKEAEEKRKRKDEDFDSEDDDLEEWEAKDKAQQEEKARKIREAAQKAPGFVFKPSSGGETSSASIFSTKPASTSIFGQSKAAESDNSTDKAEPEKEQGKGDHTWTPETPIKFGSTAASQGSTTPVAPPPANPFGGLFGSKTFTPDGKEPAKLAPPTIGFKFGPATTSSLATSRATTPGLTTDGEASTAGDDSEAASEQAEEKQVEDMTALLPEEKEEHDVLLEVSIAKAMKLDQKKTETGTVKAYVEKGKGPLYILKNKATGKVRVLLKVPPLGRAAMNFAPLKGLQYLQARPKTITGAFMDHLDEAKDKNGKLSQWTISVREPADAAKIADILMDNRPQ